MQDYDDLSFHTTNSIMQENLIHKYSYINSFM